MKFHSTEPLDLNRMRPLLLSIQGEITDRCRAVVALEQRLLAFGSTPRIHAVEIATAKAVLAIQRRELRRIGKELSRIGITFDAAHPRAILAPTQVGSRTSNEETGYRPMPSTPPR